MLPHGTSGSQAPGDWNGTVLFHSDEYFPLFVPFSGPAPTVGWTPLRKISSTPATPCSPSLPVTFSTGDGQLCGIVAGRADLTNDQLDGAHAAM